MKLYLKSDVISHSSALVNASCSLLCNFKVFKDLPKLLSTINSSPNFQKQSSEEGSKIQLQIKQYLQRKAISHDDGWTCYSLHDYFQYSDIKSATVKKTKNSSTNNMTCFVNKTNGNFSCAEMYLSGSWEQFQTLNSFKEIENWEKYNNLLKELQLDKVESEPGLKMWNTESNDVAELTSKNAVSILENFGLAFFPVNFLQKHKLKFQQDFSAIIFPYFSLLSKPRPTLCGIKVVQSFNARDSAVHNFLPLKTSPNYNVSMFGLAKKQPSRILVLTENEYDALSINFSSSKYTAICLWHGTTQLPIDILPYLEHFSSIVLWFNNNLLSIESAHGFARKLNTERCKIVRTNVASAYVALRNGMDLDKIIDSANPINVQNIVKYDDIEFSIIDELRNHKVFCGMQWKRFPALSKILKGHRQGELTVLTGATGCGKTTLASELSLDLAMQGVSTLWGSFEISNTALIKSMLKQFSYIDLENKMDRFAKVSEDFKSLPIYFMTYRGSQKFTEVLRTINHACYVNDIQHVIIDNLQFMLGNQYSIDRFAFQDYVVGQFRKLATANHVHVTVIVHPRKEDPNLPLHISSIFGSAKCTQEADNVLILQKYKANVNYDWRKYLEVAKNRFDGEMGNVALYFDKHSRCMSKLPELSLNQTISVHE